MFYISYTSFFHLIIPTGFTNFAIRDAGGTASARKAFMAYVSEGLGREQDWDHVMAYQRKNGSLFNSPSTTAASAIHSCNDRALDYLVSLTSKLGGPGAYCSLRNQKKKSGQKHMSTSFEWDFFTVDSFFFFSASDISRQGILPALHGGHPWEDGNLFWFCLRHTRHIGHDLQVFATRKDFTTEQKKRKRDKQLTSCCIIVPS